jgi:sulfur carrier protein
MEIKLNGQPLTLSEPQTLDSFLESHEITLETRGVAVAKNGRVVPRSSWEQCLLEMGDEVEVIHAVAGG